MARYATRVEAGLCSSHSRPTRPGLKTCELCNEHRRTRAKQLRAAGMCTGHPNRPVYQDYTSCKECLDKRRAYNREYSSRPEKRAQTQAWKDANRPKLREYNLVRLYGITIEQYDTLFQIQGGVCAICSQPPKEGKKPLHVDHDHVTGSVRALLCGECNKSLGGFQDSPELLDKAAAYLRKYKV